MAKTFLIVGAGSGIGLSLTRALTESGYDVIGTQRSDDNFPEIPRANYQVWDTNSTESTLDLPEAINGMAYCPGSISLKPFNKFTDDDFAADWNTNCLGAVKAIRQSLPALKQSPTASILLFSTVAVQTGLSFHASIAAAKGAVEGLTRSLAAELAPNIRVNAIAPSLTETPLASQLINSPEKIEASANRHPLKRIGSPDEIAQLGHLLLSEDSGFVTGQIIAVDGGMSSLRMF